MGEQGDPIKPKAGDLFGYARRKIEPKLREAEEEVVASGVERGTPVFRKLRQNFGRKFIEKEQQGEIDELTGLLNRKGFTRRVNEELGRAQREGTEMVIMVLDVNSLKEINDREGHGVGDQLIRDVADGLGNNSRPYDVLARAGGDEFYVLLPRMKLEEAHSYWERLNSSFEGNEKSKTSISIAAGVAAVDVENFDTSLALADAAMYKAKATSKSQGRNTMRTAFDLSKQKRKAVVERKGMITHG